MNLNGCAVADRFPAVLVHRLCLICDIGIPCYFRLLAFFQSGFFRFRPFARHFSAGSGAISKTISKVLLEYPSLSECGPLAPARRRVASTPIWSSDWIFNAIERDALLDGFTRGGGREKLYSFLVPESLPGDTLPDTPQTADRQLKTLRHGARTGNTNFYNLYASASLQEYNV